MDPEPRPQPHRDSPLDPPEFVGRLGMTAAQLHGYIEQLEVERAIAVQTELAEVDAYMDDLTEELELVRDLFVTSAVTEIATLRAELSGAQYG
jgi:predicted trehalose synthase